MHSNGLEPLTFGSVGRQVHPGNEPLHFTKNERFMRNLAEISATFVRLTIPDFTEIMNLY